MKRLALTSVLLLFAVFCRLRGSTVISWEPPPDASPIINVFWDGPMMYAYDFLVGSSDLSATSFGVWEMPSISVHPSYNVGIWTTGGTLIASATIPEGAVGTVVDEFRYIELSTPVRLEAGHTYVIGSWSAATTSFVRLWSSWDASGHPDFALLSANSIQFQSQALEFPSDFNANGPYLGPSFQYDVIPEPVALISVLLIYAGGILGHTLRRELQPAAPANPRKARVAEPRRSAYKT